jgi:hypothetical protein
MHQPIIGQELTERVKKMCVLSGGTLYPCPEGSPHIAKTTSPCLSCTYVHTALACAIGASELQNELDMVKLIACFSPAPDGISASY